VLAAVELRQHLQEEAAFSAPTRGQRVLLRMGLHTGSLVVGPLPYTPQQLYTALGATTTLATVLQQRAHPEAILLSAATYELVQAEIHGIPAGTLHRTGQPVPLLIYTVQGVRQRHGGVPGRRRRPLTRYVGRERELAVLHDHLEQARQGQGQVLGIVGEPGMGKSRLLYEFVQQVTEQAVTYYEGHCLPYGTTTPYGPTLAVLRQHCGLLERAAPATITMWSTTMGRAAYRPWAFPARHRVPPLSAPSCGGWIGKRGKPSWGHGPRDCAAGRSPRRTPQRASPSRQPVAALSGKGSSRDR
jgi:AAA ATPase domain/Adenylate and Guanylate cyclase catalytic domain